MERRKSTYITYSKQYGAFFTIIGEVEQYVPNSKTISAETKKPSINAFLIPVFRVWITQFKKI